MQRAHLIEKQRLKRAGIRALEVVWDPRILRWSCEFHHSLYDRHLWHLPRDAYGRAVEQFALEQGFDWLGERERWRKVKALG